MDPEELTETYPRVFHMAHPGAWEGIQRHGLLSTTALLDLFEISGDERRAIESQRRPEPVVITHPIHGEAWIRDNKPLHDSRLEVILVGMSKEDYYRLLNRHVFSWPTQERLEGLLGASAYRDDPHLVLEIDTEALVRAHGSRIGLSPYNLGSTLYNAPQRGPDTLRAIEDYDFEHWRLKRSRRTAVGEIAVDYSVPDVLDLMVRAAIRHPNGECEILLER